MLLEVKGIHTYYGKSHILNDVSLQIDKGETVALLGRNGFGKSTTLKSIMGLAPPRSGSILFKGKEIAGQKPYLICRQGVGFVPQERRIFPNLTVRQNLLLGERPNKTMEAAWTIAMIYEHFPQLGERDRQRGRFLSGGEQQMLTIGRGLMAQPRLLLVDEPSLGLAPVIQDHLYQTLGKLRESRITILLPEQNALRALGIADRGYVMQDGRIVLEGNSADLLQSDLVKKAYLGR